MFCDYNTDSLHIINVFTATVNKEDIGKRLKSFGETGFYQLGIKLKGSTSITYNNEKYCYDDNSVIFLPREKRGDIVYNKVFRQPGSGVCIFFTSEHPLSDKAKLYRFCDTSAAKAFNRILHEFQSENPLRVKSLFYEILSLLDENEKPRRKGALSEVLKYINDNINAPYIDLQKTAEKFGYSPDYFRHKFRSEMGVSPQKYIASLKIESAKELLLNSSLIIEQVAFKTGFNDPNYFTRFFKKETGYTPAAFRKNYKKYF